MTRLKIGVPYTTTLAAISALDPRPDEYAKLCRWLLAQHRPPEAPFPMAWILESNGLDGTLWALHTLGDHHPMPQLFAMDCAERMLDQHKQDFPYERFARQYIETSRRRLLDAEHYPPWGEAVSGTSEWEPEAWTMPARVAAALLQRFGEWEASNPPALGVRTELEWHCCRLRDYLNGLLPVSTLDYLGQPGTV